MSSTNKSSQLAPVVVKAGDNTVSASGTTCDQANHGWEIAMQVFAVFFLLMLIFATTWIILWTANPYWVQLIERGAEEPVDNAQPDSKKCSIFAAVISIGITIILAIIFSCTSCRKSAMNNMTNTKMIA